jgi:hypothetical protein
MPVVFPGFSWANLKGDPALRNRVPRDGGKFYWRQVRNAAEAGATMLFNANFDEVDEGTAMFKPAPSASGMPAGGRFLALDADGYVLPGDWHLRLAGAAAAALKAGGTPPRGIPILPRLDRVAFGDGTAGPKRLARGGSVGIRVEGANLPLSGGIVLEGLPAASAWKERTPERCVLEIPLREVPAWSYTLLVKTFDLRSEPLELEVGGEYAISRTSFPGLDAAPHYGRCCKGLRLSYCQNNSCFRQSDIV